MYCSPSADGDRQTCFNHKQLKDIARAYNNNVSNATRHIKINQSKSDLWNQIRDAFSDQCENEWCWISKDVVMQTRDPQILKNTFRPEHPEGGRHKWLTTSKIHDVMKQYELVHKDFVFFGPVPMDFRYVIPHVGELNVVRLFKKGITKIGIVFNTDPSTKPGKHWISMFINLHPQIRSISFFDSFAICPPPVEVQKLMDHIAKQAPKLYGDKTFTVNCNSIRHQFANSECGVYSINFITESLEGKTFEQIAGNIVRDEEMNRKRDLYFRPFSKK